MSDRLIGTIVAAVLILLALAGLGAYITNGFGMNTVTNIVGDVTSAMTSARQAFGQGSNGYTNFTTANASQLISAGVWSGKVVGGNPVDRWGNSVTFGNTSSDTQGTIGFGGGGSETVETCAQAAVNVSNYVSLKVGSTTFTPSAPPDAVTAATACGTGLAFTVTFM